MDTVNAILPFVLPAVGTGLAIGLIWLFSKLHLSAKLESTIEALIHRGIDTAQADAAKALTPDSDGGAVITHAEFAALVQHVFQVVKSGLGDSGLLNAALKMGEDWILGKISMGLKKIGIIPTADVAVTTATPADATLPAAAAPVK